MHQIICKKQLLNLRSQYMLTIMLQVVNLKKNWRILYSNLKKLCLLLVLIWEDGHQCKGHQSENICNEIAPVSGLNWLTSEDTLSCNFKFSYHDNGDMTKRIILSLTGHIFDLVGFLFPVSLIPKLLIHECLQRKLPWDSKLPSDIEKKFMTWQRELKFIKDLKIPRSLLNCFKSEAGLSFHVFCHASQYAYATKFKSLKVRRNQNLKVL